MKLINKFTAYYMAITTLVLLLGGVIVFYSVQSEIEKEVTRRLKRDIDHTAALLKQNIPVDSLLSDQISIHSLPYDQPLLPLKTSDSMVHYSPLLQILDRKFSVAASYKMDGKHYYISAHNFIAEPDEILEGVLFSLGFTLLILILFVGLVSRLMSKQILLPFNQILKTIQTFSLNQKNQIRLPHTETYEFKELNQFLKKMTSKALDDYRSLKEFSENASHELQTPLAIMRGKLELLIDTNINEEQASFILSIQNAVHKLSAINQSLALLTKLENQEYQAQKINFSSLVDKTISSFGELIQMKSISLATHIEPNVYIQLNPALADILFTNLLSNAIRHNNQQGSIKVALSSTSLVIDNTGDIPKIDTSELFKRFKKQKQNSESIGLGLAIVKQICDLNKFGIHYQFIENRHVVTVIFSTPE